MAIYTGAFYGRLPYDDLNAWLGDGMCVTDMPHRFYMYVMHIDIVWVYMLGQACIIFTSHLFNNSPEEETNNLTAALYR